MIRIIRSESNNPYYNLALEEILLHKCENEKCIVLYLWQNDNTVVVGRNQNVFSECNMQFANEHHSHIARRKTGGGTVYHDLGNLNFTIITPIESYDIVKSTGVIVSALNKCGLKVEITGRNDITIDGKKISGSAYYKTDMASLHHGTIIVDVDLERMQQLLYAKNGKIARNGIQSVRSRVSNLCEYDSSISLDLLSSNIKSCFLAIYKDDDVNDSVIDTPLYLEAMRLKLEYQKDSWIYNSSKKYDLYVDNKFEWGYVQIGCILEGKKIVNYYINSDSLFPDIIDEVERIINSSDNKLIECINICSSNAERKAVFDIEHLFKRLTTNAER